jgi:hypothetical protein
MHAKERSERIIDTPRARTPPPRRTDAFGELSPRAVADLQHAIGNAAVARMIEVQRLPEEDRGKRKRADTATEAGPEQRRARTGKWYSRWKTHRNEPGGDRPAELRMLDRVARVLYKSLEEWDKQNQQQFGGRATPHFAVYLDNDGRLHVSGNTDRPFTEKHRQQAERRLQSILSGEPLDKSLPRRERKDANKVGAHLVGAYQPEQDNPEQDNPEQDNEEWKAPLAAALRAGIQWDIASLDPHHQQGPTDKVVHGEMILLGDIVKYWVAKGPAEKNVKRKPVYLGGYKPPCQPCQWLIESVNAVFGKTYGFKIETMETHKGIPDTWHAPDWLFRGDDKEYAITWELLQRKAGGVGKSFDGSRLTLPKKEGESSYAPESASEYYSE